MLRSRTPIKQRSMNASFERSMEESSESEIRIYHNPHQSSHQRPQPSHDRQANQFNVTPISSSKSEPMRSSHTSSHNSRNSNDVVVAELRTIKRQQEELLKAVNNLTKVFEKVFLILVSHYILYLLRLLYLISYLIISVICDIGIIIMILYVILGNASVRKSS